MAVAIVALTSCQNEQSQLDFADVEGKAVVQGYVYIDKGYIQDGDNYVVKSLPAEGCAVLVKVPYTKYDADAAAGDKFFEGVCDANGFYTIEVPVGQSAITGVNVYTRPIVDKYYDLINGAIVEKQASYPEASASVELERGKIYTASNIYIQKGVESPIMSRSQVIKLNGVVKEECEVQENTNDDITVKAKVPAAWTDQITAWVWATGGEGKEIVPTQEGEWYVYTQNCAELNIIFKNGAGWNGDANQTVDITVTESTCIEITADGATKATYTIVDCEGGDVTLEIKAGQRKVSQKVELAVTFTNSQYPTEKIVYNITTDYDGKYDLSANLYDTWNVANTTVKVETKPYLASVTHYYREKNLYYGTWTDKSQSVSGYYNSKTVSKNLSAGDLLIGTKINDIVLTFTPDKNNNTIYGIGDYEVDYDDNYNRIYKSENPLNW